MLLMMMMMLMIIIIIIIKIRTIIINKQLNYVRNKSRNIHTTIEVNNFIHAIRNINNTDNARYAVEQCP